MVDDKDIKTQINEYQRRLEDMKVENINLPKGFVARNINKKPSQFMEQLQATTKT